MLCHSSTHPHLKDRHQYKLPLVCRFRGFPVTEECKENCRCFRLALVTDQTGPQVRVTHRSSVQAWLLRFMTCYCCGKLNEKNGPGHLREKRIHKSRNHLRSACLSVSILLLGSALPSGCVNRCVGVCVYISGNGKGLQLWMLISLPVTYSPLKLYMAFSLCISHTPLGACQE